MEFHPDRWGTNLFKRISRFDVNIQLDPYAQDATGKTINTFTGIPIANPFDSSMPRSA